MTITCYKNTSERNRVDKTNFLQNITTLNGTLRDSVSLTNPIIRIRYEYPNFNYVYITELNRYYFVEDIVSVRNGLWELTLAVDVLMTYKEGILNTVGFIERSQSLYDDKLIDKKRIIEQGYDIENTEILNDVFINVGDLTATTAWVFVMNGYKLEAVPN